MNDFKAYSIAAIIKTIVIALFLAGFCTMPAHAQKRKKKGKTQKVAVIGDNKTQKLFYDGMAAKLKDDTEAAAMAFSQILEIDPKNDVAAYELAQIKMSKNELEDALKYATQASKLKPENKWYHLMRAQIFEVTGEYNQAADAYRKLIELSPNKQEYYYDLSYMLVKDKKYEEAIKLFDKLEQKMGVNETILFQKQHLYLQMGKSEEAIKEVQRLIDANPDEPNYYQNLAELYLATGEYDKAMETYRAMAEADPDNPQSILAMAEYYKAKGDDAKYLETLKKAVVHPDLETNEKMRYIAPYFLNKEGVVKSEAFELMDLMLEAEPDNAETNLMYGELLYADNKRPQALERYKAAVAANKDLLDAWRQILWLQYELNDYDALITDSKEMISLFPNEPTAYYFNGMGYKMLERYEEAIKPLKRGAMVSAGDPEQGVQILSMLGEIYHDMKDYPNSDKYYEKALELDPENANVLNNYSYFLSLRKNMPEKAAEMAKKANELTPGNAAYQDTYGWVLYKQKKYKEAEEWLKKALENGGDQDGTILEHYGDVLFQLKDVDNALKHWQKAKQMGGASEMLDKKIRDKKLY